MSVPIFYIGHSTAEEQAKRQKAADAFEELYEMADIVALDVDRYGFVMLKYYMPPHGFEEDVTFTDSRALFEELWQEWLDMKLYFMAKGIKVYLKVFQKKNSQNLLGGRMICKSSRHVSVMMFLWYTRQQLVKEERIDVYGEWKNQDCRYCRRTGSEYSYRIECYSWENKENIG